MKTPPLNFNCCRLTIFYQYLSFGSSLKSDTSSDTVSFDFFSGFLLSIIISKLLSSDFDCFGAKAGLDCAFSAFSGKFHVWDPNLGKLGLTKRGFHGIQKLGHMICELKTIGSRQDPLKDRPVGRASSPLPANGSSGNRSGPQAASVFR